jgi:hypothetical protein
MAKLSMAKLSMAKLSMDNLILIAPVIEARDDETEEAALLPLG